MNGRDASAAMNASLLLDGEDRILEGNRDAEVFLEKPLEEVRKAPLHVANPSLYSALKELLSKTKRGRGVEDYAMAYKVGKRLMRLNVDVSPYPLEALGATGTLVTIRSAGPRPAPERRVPGGEAAAPPAPEEDLGLPQLLAIMVEPAFMLDFDANFTYVNPAMCALLAHAEEELVGRPLSFFMRREEAKQALDRLVEAAVAAPWRGELEFTRGDGGVCFVAATITALKTGRGKAKRLLGIGRDHTAEVRLRREREDELQRVWSLLESVGLALVCFTPDLRVTLLSHSAQEVLGTSSDRAIGTPLPELFPAETREEVAGLLERAVGGEEAEEAMVRAGSGKETRALFMGVRPGVMFEGRAWEYVAVMREAARELSQAEEAEAQLKALRRKVSILELALHNPDPRIFLQKCLDGLRDEFGCAAAAAFSVKRSMATLRMQVGLEAGETEVLSSLKLRPGHARLCAGLVRLGVEVHGGIPRRGWDEVHSFLEKADALLPLLRERRMRSITAIPLRRDGEAEGALVLADCDPAKVDALDDVAFSALGEAVAAALGVLEGRAAEALAEEAAGGGRTARSGAADAPAGATRWEPGDAAGGEPAAPGARGGDDGGAPAAAKEAEKERGREHDYFESAREAKGEESPPDNLALFGESPLERSMPSPQGIDLAALLRDIKEYYGKEKGEGEIFLEIEEDLPKLHADKRLLRETLLQLVDNARHFSPPDAPVILGAERWGDEVLLHVEDQGPGIPVEIVEEVMRAPLEGADAGSAGRLGAHGLYLCRRYVGAMGGDFSIKGRPDEGTTAFVRLRVLPFIGEIT